MQALLMAMAMGAILVTWCALAAVFAGIGLLVRRLLAREPITSGRPLLEAFWMGFAALLLVLQLWHFLFPVRWHVLALALLPAAGGLWLERRGLRDCLQRALTNHRAFGLAALIAGVWLANRSIGPCETFDSGLYHLSAVKWIQTHPVVPGLANLHNRFGYNNSSFLYDAMLDVGLWKGRANHICNGLLAFLVLLQFLHAAEQFMAARPPSKACLLLEVILLPAVLLAAVHSWLSSYSMDLPVVMVALVASSKLFCLAVEDNPSPAERRFQTVLTCMLLCMAVCFKISTIVFALTGWVVAIGVYLARTYRKGPVLKTLGFAAAGSILLIVPWLARGVVLSGYPLYPSRLGAVPVEWKLPEAIRRMDAESISSFARSADIENSGHHWMVGRIRTLNREMWLPICLVGLGGIFALIVSFRRKWAHAARHGGWILLVHSGAGIVFWFVTAPLPRFGWYMCWIFAAGLLASLFRCFAGTWRKRTHAVILAGLLVLAAVNVKKFFIGPGPDYGFHPTPVAQFEPYRTRSGLVVNVPTGRYRLCWNAPLPCSPQKHPNLALRREGDLSGGFVMRKHAAEQDP